MGNSSSSDKKHRAKNIPGGAGALKPPPPLEGGRSPGQITKFTQKGSSEPAAKARDVMISYSHQDVEIMRKIKGLFESSGISVWVDETGLTVGAQYLREIGEAIVDSSTFLVILSKDSVISKYCQDEVSLAYISNKNIFAIAVNPFEELTPIMDLGMKLTLSAVQWHIIDASNVSKRLAPLISSVKTVLTSIQQQNAEQDHDGGTSEEDEAEEHTNYVMNKQAFKLRRMMSRAQISVTDYEDDDSEEVDPKDKGFWSSHFGKETQVEWSRFSQALDETYVDVWTQLMVTEQQKQLLLHLMSKEMAVRKGVIMLKEFRKFCTRDRETLPFSQAIRLYAAETYAMKEVFNINSSVRLSAIGNLRKYQSKAVIDSLLDLIESEEDPDVKVVASISLAYAASGIKMFKRRAEEGLIVSLEHSDRLVRESGCLALGRLKSKKSIPKLVNVWRNDYISTVREAAQIAINQIGGDEAEQAMHVTKVLSEEIALLKN